MLLLFSVSSFCQGRYNIYNGLALIDENSDVMRIDPRKKVRDVAGEHIVMMQSGTATDMTKVVALNASALHLYGLLLERQFDDEEVVRLILDEYEVDEATARHDAAAWIESMKREGLIID